MHEATQWLANPLALPDEAARREAQARQAILTKPQGALGRLEEMAISLAALQGTARPCLDTISISVFAADHGVAKQGVSAFPQAVTAQMVRNFAQGGAAINVLAHELGVELEVVHLGTVHELEPLDGVVSLPLGAGTADLCHQPAMTGEQLHRGLAAGRATIERAAQRGAQLFIGGEMGIGNTTAAAALACALLDLPPALLTGPGTGLDAAGVGRKIEVVGRALERHAESTRPPLEALRRLGGFEIAALAGSYVACAQRGLPVLVDGFISSVASLAAARLCPGADGWFLFAHASAEPGHRVVLEALGAQPFLDLGMRLGEGSGAAVALPLLRLACALHNDMASFSEAGVANRGS